MERGNREKHPDKDKRPDSTSRSTSPSGKIDDFFKYWSENYEKEQKNTDKVSSKEEHEFDLIDRSDSIIIKDEKFITKRIRSSSMEGGSNDQKKLKQTKSQKEILFKSDVRNSQIAPFSQLHYTPGMLREMISDIEESRSTKYKIVRDGFKTDREDLSSIEDATKEIDDYIKDAAIDLSSLIESSKKLLEEAMSKNRDLSTRGLADARERLNRSLDDVRNFQNEGEKYQQKREGFYKECEIVVDKYNTMLDKDISKIESEHRIDTVTRQQEIGTYQRDYLDKKKTHRDVSRMDTATEDEISRHRIEYEEAEREYKEKKLHLGGEIKLLEKQKPEKINKLKEQYWRSNSDACKYYAGKVYDLAIEQCSEQELHHDSLRNAYTDLSQMNTRVERYQQTIANVRDDSLRRYLSNSENGVATAIDNLVTFSQHFRNPSDRENRIIQNVEYRIEEVLSAAQRFTPNLRQILDRLSVANQELEQRIRIRAEEESKKKGKEKVG